MTKLPLVLLIVSGVFFFAAPWFTQEISVFGKLVIEGFVLMILAFILATRAD